jgi:hypothetical protein
VAEADGRLLGSAFLSTLFPAQRCTPALALAFRAGLGARPWDDVVSLRVDGPALAELAGEGDG